MSLVSIIMPIYNNARYLRESLDSVINLNYKNIEIIVIDDGSVDQSVEIIKEYCKSDNRIVFFQNEKNMGTAKTIKEGIKKSNGKFVFFNAGDDISLKDRIEKCLDIFQQNKGIGLIASTTIVIDKNSQETGEMLEINEQIQNHNIALEQFKRNYCLGATMAIVNDKDILLKDGMLEYMDDYETSLEYLLNGYNIYLLRQPLVKYRLHDNNQSNSRRILSEKVKMILKKYRNEDIYNNLISRGYDSKEIYVTLGVLNLFKDNVEDALKYLKMADGINNELESKKLEFEKSFYLGVVNYRLDNLKESFERFQQAYNIDRYNPAILNNIGVLKCHETKDKIESIKRIELALKIYPDYIDAKRNIENITANMYDNLKITERIIDIQVYKREQYNI